MEPVSQKEQAAVLCGLYLLREFLRGQMIAPRMLRLEIYGRLKELTP